MKVLLVNPTVAIGGAERSLIELAQGLDGPAITLLASCIQEGPLPKALREAGVRVEVNPWPTFALTIGRGSAASKLLLPLAAAALVPHLLRMASLVRREGIRVIHTNGLKSHVAGSLVRLLTGCRVAWHVRDVLAPGVTRKAFRLLARMGADRVIANSRTVAETFAGLPPGKVVTVYNGFDTDRYAPGPDPGTFRSSVGVAPDAFLVGAMGALAPLKGHLHIIRAAPAVLAKRPGTRFVIVGKEYYLTSGHRGYRSVLEDEIARLGLEGKVILAGHREDPVAVLRSLNALVHASVYPESFGRVIVEAMACQVPVVATALGGPTEIIRSDEEGVLIPAGDPEAIARAVLGLQDDPARCAALGKAGRRRAVEAYGLSRYVREVEAVYAALA